MFISFNLLLLFIFYLPLIAIILILVLRSCLNRRSFILRLGHSWDSMDRWDENDEMEDFVYISHSVMILFILLVLMALFFMSFRFVPILLVLSLLFVIIINIELWFVSFNIVLYYLFDRISLILSSSKSQWHCINHWLHIFGHCYWIEYRFQFADALIHYFIDSGLNGNGMATIDGWRIPAQYNQ